MPEQVKSTKPGKVIGILAGTIIARWLPFQGIYGGTRLLSRDQGGRAKNSPWQPRTQIMFQVILYIPP